MSTRGAFGIRINGIDKLVYNHCDSYPGGLGAELVSELPDVMADPDLRYKAECLKPDSSETTKRRPTRALRDLLVGRTFSDSSDFIYDSLFCEHAYILNLDTNQFEVYGAGSQSQPHDRGRYGQTLAKNQPHRSKERSNLYYGCRLVAAFDANNIPKNWVEIVRGTAAYHECIKYGVEHRSEDEDEA